MTALQKLLTPALAGAVVETGSLTLGGPVVRAVDAVDLSPAELASAHGWVGPGLPWESEPAHVDVLRFDSNPLMDLRTPGPVGERPWPTYENGFLRGPTVLPVWLLTRTRVPVGTEYWRIDADGRERQFSFYAGPGVGWSGAKGFRPPVGLTGPRARWRGAELPASLTEDGRGVELVSISDEAPEGFETTRPGVHRRIVPLAECDTVFELDLVATWLGAPVRVLQVAGEQAQVQLLVPDPASVERLQAIALEPGSYEAVAPRAELSDTEGATRELPVVQQGPAAHVGLTMLGQAAGARFLEAGSTVTLPAPILTTRWESLAWGSGSQALYAIWSRTGRPVAEGEGEDDAVELAAGTTLRLVETRLIEGIDVHLVVEVADGDAEPESVLVELAAAARAALEAGGGPSYTSDRFVGDIG